MREPDDRIRALISAAHKGKVVSEDTKAKLRGGNNPMFGMCGDKNPFFGRKHSPESRAKMAESQKAKNAFGARNNFFGRTHSPESRAKMSESLRGRPSPHKGKPSPNKGKRVSDETRARMSDAAYKREAKKRCAA